MKYCRLGLIEPVHGFPFHLFYYNSDITSIDLYREIKHIIMFYSDDLRGSQLCNFIEFPNTHVQSNLSSKTTQGKTQKWSLKTGGLCSQVNLFFISVSGTNKFGLYLEGLCLQVVFSTGLTVDRKMHFYDHPLI
jgi:hypothetical protein